MSRLCQESTFGILPPKENFLPDFWNLQLKNLTANKFFGHSSLRILIIFAFLKAHDNQNFFKTSETMAANENFEKNGKIDENDLSSLKQWYSKQSHLPGITDEIFSLFLYSCDHNVESTKATIDNYFTIRTHSPEFFDCRNPFVVNIKNGSPVGYFALLNKRTPDGCKVLVMKLANTNPSDFVFSDQIKAFNMLIDMEVHKRGPFPGLVVVFDMEGTSFGHVSRLNVVHIKKSLYYVQEAMPVKLKGIHYINPISFMDVILGMVKPFMKKSLLDVLHIHAQGMDSFYEFVPKDILPKDYGGEDFSVEELHEKTLKILQDNKNWFEEDSKLKVDESKRIGKSRTNELFGMEGSFKKLNFD